MITFVRSKWKIFYPSTSNTVIYSFEKTEGDLRVLKIPPTAGLQVGEVYRIECIHVGDNGMESEPGILIYQPTEESIFKPIISPVDNSTYQTLEPTFAITNLELFQYESIINQIELTLVRLSTSGQPELTNTVTRTTNINNSNFENPYNLTLTKTGESWDLLPNRQYTSEVRYNDSINGFSLMSDRITFTTGGITDLSLLMQHTPSILRPIFNLIGFALNKSTNVTTLVNQLQYQILQELGGTYQAVYTSPVITEPLINGVSVGSPYSFSPGDTSFKLSPNTPSRILARLGESNFYEWSSYKTFEFVTGGFNTFTVTIDLTQNQYQPVFRLTGFSFNKDASFVTNVTQIGYVIKRTDNPAIVAEDRTVTGAAINIANNTPYIFGPATEILENNVTYTVDFYLYEANSFGWSSPISMPLETQGGFDYVTIQSKWTPNSTKPVFLLTDYHFIKDQATVTNVTQFRYSITNMSDELVWVETTLTGDFNNVQTTNFEFGPDQDILAQNTNYKVKYQLFDQAEFGWSPVYTYEFLSGGFVDPPVDEQIVVPFSTLTAYNSTGNMFDCSQNAGGYRLLIDADQDRTIYVANFNNKCTLHYYNLPYVHIDHCNFVVEDFTQPNCQILTASSTVNMSNMVSPVPNDPYPGGVPNATAFINKFGEAALVTETTLSITP